MTNKEKRQVLDLLGEAKGIIYRNCGDHTKTRKILIDAIEGYGFNL